MAGRVDSGTETPPAQPPSVLCPEEPPIGQSVEEDAEQNRRLQAFQQLQRRRLERSCFPPQPLTARHVTDTSLLETSPVSTANMNEIKIAVLGSEGVGKSALNVRFLTRRFIGEYASSSECIYRKLVSVDGRQVNLELYDPCSQACEGKSTLNDQIHWADGFIVVYDISNRSSFFTAKAIVHLIRELHLGTAKRDADSLIFLVGNKQDLSHMREVRREEGQCLAAEFHCQFYELSAAEHYHEVALIFSKMVQNTSLGSKAKERRRRPSGSKSMAKLINNVFGKRRKSV